MRQGHGPLAGLLRDGALTRAVNWLPRGGGLQAEDWDRRHRGLLAVLWVHAVAVPVFGAAQGYEALHSLLESSPIIAAGALATWAPLNRTTRAAIVSLGLLTASALLVHFSGGYIEFHFHFFVMIGLLSLYQHWLPFLGAVAYVALHHGLAGVMDPSAVYNHPEAIAHPWRWAAIHATFVFGAGAANVFIWRLSEQEQKRRRDVELVTEAALARLPLPELLTEVLSRVRAVVAADVATIALKDLEGGPPTIRATQGAHLSDAETAVIRAGGVVSRVLEQGEAVIVEQVQDGDVDNPVLCERGVRSLAGVPLMVEGTSIGVLDVGSDRERRFSDRDISLLQLVADRIAPAIDRARLHEREHRIAETLQLSLLPKQLPTVSGVELGFRYRPAGQGLAVGGDWYDAVVLPGGRLGLAMGDVVGHGTDAASLMGQLRTALRAYALEGHGPRETVTRLDELTCGLGEGHMATLLYGELDPDTGELTYYSAGHPPAIVCSSDGAVHQLPGTGGTPLGAGITASHGARTVQLEPGATLVLYTDGLVESRETGVDGGLTRLHDALARDPAIGVEELCDLLLDEVPLCDRGRDDVAVLLVRLAGLPGEHLELSYPALPGSAAPLRRTLERWLGYHGVAEDAAFAIVTAANEAAANAIEHAYGAHPAEFSVQAERRDGEVLITVTDTGRWRSPRGPDRGRGLVMIDTLMDSLEVDRTLAGTKVAMRHRVEKASLEPAPG